MAVGASVGCVMGLDRIGNISIRVFANDTKKHRRPYLHAVGPEDNVVVSLPDLRIIEGALAPGHRDRFRLGGEKP